MNKLVRGVGINDLPYRAQVKEEVTKNGGKRIQKSVFTCKYYTAWTDMLTRCYSKKLLESYPTYIGTSVCSEWLYATTFKKWMDQQDWHGKSLDKDIIVPGNKLYSPETCAFVLQATNLFVIARDASYTCVRRIAYSYKNTISVCNTYPSSIRHVVLCPRYTIVCASCTCVRRRRNSYKNTIPVCNTAPALNRHIMLCPRFTIIRASSTCVRIIAYSYECTVPVCNTLPFSIRHNVLFPRSTFV